MCKVVRPGDMTCDMYAMIYREFRSSGDIYRAIRHIRLCQNNKPPRLGLHTSAVARNWCGVQGGYRRSRIQGIFALLRGRQTVRDHEAQCLDSWVLYLANEREQAVFVRKAAASIRLSLQFRNMRLHGHAFSTVGSGRRALGGGPLFPSCAGSRCGSVGEPARTCKLSHSLTTSCSRLELCGSRFR
jgi:hypothetical protein